MQGASKAVGVVVLGLLMAGCGSRNATISDMMPTGLVSGKFGCWVTLEFKQIPEGIDARDVKVTFSSPCMPAPQSFDWAFIASHALVKKASGVGRERATKVSPNADPVLNYPIDLSFPLEAKDAVQDISASDFILDVELDWGGQKQDTDYASIRHLYSRQP